MGSPRQSTIGLTFGSILFRFFGEYLMKDLNPEMVQQFVSGSVASAKTTRNICITLQSMWTTAKAWG